MRTDMAQTGAAGAYYTAAQLSQRGWAASLTVGNMPRTDLVAQEMGPSARLIAVQCKAANAGGSFQVGLRGELPSPPGSNEWYVFIELFEPDRRPSFYVVPRNVVAAFAWVGHRAWLTGTRRDGSPRRNGSMRSIQAHEFAAYREQWDLLDAPADEAPYMLPEWFFGWLDDPRVGLPDEHPGITNPQPVPQGA